MASGNHFLKMGLAVNVLRVISSLPSPLITYWHIVRIEMTNFIGKVLFMVFLAKIVNCNTLVKKSWFVTYKTEHLLFEFIKINAFAMVKHAIISNHCIE